MYSVDLISTSQLTVHIISVFRDLNIAKTQNIIMYLGIYYVVGIFEKHKLLFSFQMTMKLEQSTGTVSQAELDFFIKGSVSLEKSARPIPGKWLSSQVKYKLCILY